MFREAAIVKSSPTRASGVHISGSSRFHSGDNGGLLQLTRLVTWVYGRTIDRRPSNFYKELSSTSINTFCDIPPLPLIFALTLRISPSISPILAR